MRRHRGRVAVCSFIPPHMLEAIATQGDAAQRGRAFLALDISALLRGERQALAAFPTLLGFSTGEKRRTVYDARGEKKTPGGRVRGEEDGASKDVAVNEAYDGSGMTYDFFKKVYGRNSIDGRGLRLDSTVHYSKGFANAHWNGKQMVYGDGDGKIFGRFTACLDVIGHELTHGITQNTAGLEYHDQSGALNEHFSDVFGTLVKQYSLKQTADKADLIVGAGLFTKNVNGVGIRSMKAPGTAYDDKVLGKDPQPAHMRNYLKTDADNGGVHKNSGIPNRAFYEAATLIGGKAWEVTGRIWYDALTRKLRKTSTFQDCADATFTAAGEMFGQGSEPQKAVLAAWKVVGISVMPTLRVVPGIAMPGAAAEVP